jgi:hypothetical protein
MSPMVCQDILICELKMFYKQTVLELAIKGDVYGFIGLTPVQELLTDIWYGKLYPTISNWKVKLTLNNVTY